MVLTRSQSLNQRHDPAGMLGRDAMLAVMGNLEARDLMAAAQVSKHWLSLCSEEILWRQLCENLWRGKVYIPTTTNSQLSWRQKFEASVLDSARTDLTAQELCTFRWTFRFKENAGYYWIMMDPYWTKQGEMLRRFFHPEGHVTSRPKDPLFGDHERRWRFTKSSSGMKGHYVKINNWPSLRISRTGNWGWRLENCWVVYESELVARGPYYHGVGDRAPHLA